MWNTNNVSDPQRLATALGDLINPAVSQAMSSRDRFAVGKGNFTALETLYCLVQCTPDLSNMDCDRCLRVAISNMPKSGMGGRMLYPSCYSRYEMYPFFNESFIATPAPPPMVESPPPPPGSVIRPTGKVKTILIMLKVESDQVWCNNSISRW